MVTDTGALAEALDTAAQAWPDIPRGSAAIVKLASIAHEALLDQAAARARAVDTLTRFGDAYYPGYLDDVREGWPQ
jgi:hypothetical protein